MPEPLRVLLVDDDQDQLDVVSRLLKLDDFDVCTTSVAIGVTNLVRRFQPNVVLLDVHIPALSGDRLLEIVRRNAPSTTKLVLYSACDESELRRLAQAAGADGWISKSTVGPALSQRLRTICRS